MIETHPDQPPASSAHDPVLTEVVIDYERTGNDAIQAHEPRLRERIGGLAIAMLNPLAVLDRRIDRHTFAVAGTTADAKRWADETHAVVSASEAQRDSPRKNRNHPQRSGH